MSADLKSMRVVPSGKVYKQMFEAQVQLNRSLTKIPRETTSLKTSRGGTIIPIVHLSKDDIEHGLLGDRQKSWVEGFPNDPYTENPVVYKQYAEYVGNQMEEPEATIEGREVQGLPDVVVAAKEKSNIIERIAASRKERHESTVEEMHHELSVINSEMEPQINDASESLMERLRENDMVIAEIFSRFEKDEDLLTYPLEGLHNLWEELESHTPVRQAWILDLDTMLSTIEDQRMDMIKRVFKDYAKTLEKIAHILAPDLHRFMDKESQLINQTVLSNRRAYGDLYVRLLSMDIERERSQHGTWKRRVDDWKMLKTELAIKRFKAFMSEEKILSPPGVTKVTQYMLKEQEMLSHKRLEMINQLRDLQPPSSTKTSVYHWNKGVQDISQEIDTANQLHLGSLHKEYESTCQMCLEEIDRTKVELVETGVCSESRAKTVVEEFMIPLVGDRQRVYEQNLETMEKNLEEHNKTTTERLKSLFKFAQGAAHVWDVHEIGLARQERALQEKLEQCRQQHDNQNQDKEAHLDIMMDRMRQDATEKNLKDSLTKALEMLEKIRHAYEVFHKDQNNIVKQYPDMVKGELNNYDDALCRLFAVGRNKPLDTLVDGQVETEASREGEEDDEEEGESSKPDPGVGQVTNGGKRSARGSVRFSLEEEGSHATDVDNVNTKQNEETKPAPSSDLVKDAATQSNTFRDEVDKEDDESEDHGLDADKAENKQEDTNPESQMIVIDATDMMNQGDNATLDQDDPGVLEAEESVERKNISNLEGSIGSDTESPDEINSQRLDEAEDPDIDKDDLAIDKDLDDELRAAGEEVAEGALDKKKKGALAKIPFKKEPARDLQSAMTEVLSTSKGTLFYVLTEAGEYGIPAEKAPTSDRRSSGQDPSSTAFLTEVSGVSEEQAGMPEYLRTVEVEDSLLVEIKKVIRMNFLNHLEDWTDQASERASSVVVAKCEELNSELDLRLHLHKPRARRAEYDVHNVRAAELVMHSERVTRHCKGIQQALTEVRNRFTNMTTEHNNLATKFRQDIESLEVVFINATKASKLYGLKNQLNLELDKFMSIIRASLRQFRQHLDETLQMLRESNARFIKSFKVFSDGGNFCPEEIEEYRKRLDKMANNIDRSEGSIMSDLEDMESKRLEQATKVAMEFEDRFKSHMFDLIFMEKIARWLTNTQVKIKAEVANSNTQTQTLTRHLLDIERRIDACERPNLDKEQITSGELNASLKGVFESFQMRSEYINCLKDPSVRPVSGVMQGAPGVGARVGFAQDTGPTPISKAGKQPSEDPSVGVIKTIMKSNKSKMRFGVDAELDGDFVPSERDKLKSAMSTNTSSDRGKTNASRHGVSPGIASASETVRKAQSAASDMIKTSKSRLGKIKSGSDKSDATADDDDGPSLSSRNDSWTRRTSKPAKFEKKTVIFGDTNEDDENATHFLGIIRKTLKEALDGLLSAAELYYRQKGNRPVTRPQALQETLEQCADVIIQKLQSYYQQADEYHNQCLQEFRHQLTELEKSVAHIPSLVMSDVLKDQVTRSKMASHAHQAQFSQALAELQAKQDDHQLQLRPGLGHPHQKQNLASLCDMETTRHNEYIATVEQNAKALQETAVAHAQDFLESMARLSEQQLLQYDNMLVVDDVEKGRIAPKKYPTTELIRRKNAGEPLEDDEDKNALPRGKNVWSGLISNELVSGEKPAKPQYTASVTTAKTTLGHSANISARDRAYQDYKLQFETMLQQIEDEKQKLLVAEQRWMDSWNTSVEKVKMLF